MQVHMSSRAISLRACATVLRQRPLEALEIAWWWITRRKTRALNRFCAVAADIPEHYRIWLSMHQPEGLPATRSRADADTVLAVHVHVMPDQQADVGVTLCSVLSQLAGNDVLYISSTLAPFNLSFADDRRVYVLPDLALNPAQALEQVLYLTSAPYLIPLDAGTRLTPRALEKFVEAISSAPEGTTVLYADQDERDERGLRCNPWLKPQWDYDMFLAQDYLSTACVIEVRAARRAIRAVGSDDSLAVYELIARLSQMSGTHPHHVPYIAVTTEAGAWQREVPARANVVRHLLRESLGDAVVEVNQRDFGVLALRRRLPDPPPRVSVIVPTRDRLDLLETCVEGVLHRTDYPDFEVVIADNDSVEPATLAYFRRIACDPRVKIVHWPHPYSYSAVNNFAVSHATGSYLCLLNNDTEVIDATWLRIMMTHAVRREVGAVGARLLYPDRSVQHAGVVVGLGGAAGHAHRGLSDGQPGWFAHALVTRSATAVTAACLVVAREKFDAVGGLDADSLAIAYNDVDLCLKLRAAGWTNFYAADAILIHHESKSRGLDFAPEHLARYTNELAIFRQRWGTIGFVDPMHHIGLDPASETYRLKL
jgi:GT2 family glycosyltransferase